MLEKQKKQRQHLCGAQGVELLIHVDGLSGPQKDGWKALMDLAAASSLVITEEMPTSPYAQWSKVAGFQEHNQMALCVSLPCRSRRGCSALSLSA